MKAIHAYLTFDGNCREAMKFYEKCFGAELSIFPFSEGKMDYPKEAKDRIMHAKLTWGSGVLMASDSMPGMSIKPGNNFSVCVNGESRQQIDKLFAAFGEKGKITMPLQDTFWGSYFGMITDRFGINWMFGFETKPH